MICDLAETYHILDYTVLKPNTLAILVKGLSQDSRVMRHLRNEKLTYLDSMLALIFDCLRIIAYNQGHKKGAKRPQSLFEKLTKVEKKDELMKFSSPESYERWRKEHICQTQSQPHTSK